MSTQNKKEIFESHMSDALRVITAAQENAKTGETTELDVKPVPESFMRRRPGRPKKDAKDKSDRTKRATLYLTPQEYDFLREYSFNKRISMSTIIIEAALEHLGYQPPEEKQN